MFTNLTNIHDQTWPIMNVPFFVVSIVAVVPVFHISFYEIVREIFKHSTTYLIIPVSSDSETY